MFFHAMRSTVAAFLPVRVGRGGRDVAGVVGCHDMRVTRFSRMRLLVVVLLLPLAGCVLVGDRGPELVVWDLSVPVTPRELGSKVDPFVEADGPAEMDVTFPSGRRVVGVFERGGLGEATVSDPGSPIYMVVLLGTVRSPEDLRSEIGRFTDEWGPIAAGDDVAGFVDVYDRAFEKDPLLDRADFGGVGAFGSVRSFDAAAVQDGIEAVIVFRVSGDAMTVRWVLRFDPYGGDT